MKIVLTCALLVCAGLASGADVRAQPAADRPVPAAADRSAPGAPTRPEQPIVIERRAQRGSGFWTSSRPATGGAYRYRLLGIGLAVFLGMLGVMLWVIRRHRRRAEV